MKEKFHAVEMVSTRGYMTQGRGSSTVVDTYQEAVEDGEYQCLHTYGGWDAFRIEKVYVVSEEETD